MEKYPKVKVLREATGSRTAARKISELHRPADIMASADYTVIDALLIPEHAQWNIKLATNEMVIGLPSIIQNERPDQFGQLV